MISRKDAKTQSRKEELSHLKFSIHHPPQIERVALLQFLG